MAIEVTPLNILGSGGGAGAVAATSFSDNFTRANANSWGPNWGQFFLISLSNSSSMGTLINGNLGRFLQNGIGTVASLNTPIPMIWLNTLTSPRNQFAQAVLSAVSTTTSDAFVGIVGSILQATAGAASQGFYAIKRANATGLITIVKEVFSGTLATGFTETLISNLGGATSALGDTLRIEGRNSGGTWTLTGLKNGVSQGSGTDNQLQIGAPIVACDCAVAAGTLDFSSFSSGLL